MTINTGTAIHITAETEMPRFTEIAGDYIEEGFCEYIKSAMAVRDKKSTEPEASGNTAETNPDPAFLAKSPKLSPTDPEETQLLVAYLLSVPKMSRQAEEDAEANYLSAMEQVAALAAQALINPEQAELIHKTELLPEIPTGAPEAETPETPETSPPPQNNATEVPQLLMDGGFQAQAPGDEGNQVTSPQLQSFYEALESVEAKVTPKEQTPQTVQEAASSEVRDTTDFAKPEEQKVLSDTDAKSVKTSDTAQPEAKTEAQPAEHNVPKVAEKAVEKGEAVLTQAQNSEKLQDDAKPAVVKVVAEESVKEQAQVKTEQSEPLKEAELKTPLNIKSKPDEMKELLERFKLSEAAKDAVPVQAQHDPKPVVAGKEITVLPTTEAVRIADEIIARIAAKEGGVITFEMTLNPVELGKITIKIVLSGEKLTADITAQEEHTAKLLQNVTDKIQASLDKEAVKLEQLVVKHEPDYSEQQEQNGKQQQDQNAKPEADEEIEISFAELMQSMQ